MVRLNEFQIERFGENAAHLRYTNQMICASSSNSSSVVDTCQKDSGGPLIREVRQEAFQEVVI